MLQSHAGELAAIATAVCWTITAMAFELASKKVGSLSVNLLRLVAALVFLSVFTGITRGHILPLDASAYAWRWLLLSGLIGFALGDLLLFQAFVEIGARVSMLVMSLVPPITALAGWLVMGEILTPMDWLGMMLTLFGVCIVVLERKPGKGGSELVHPIRGILLALGGAAGQAIGLVLSKKGMGGYSAFSATQIRIMAGIIGFILIISMRRSWPKIREALQQKAALKHLLLGSFFGPFLGVSLSLVAVKTISTGVASTFMAIVPVLIIPPAIILFKEKVTWREIAGALIALGGIAVLYLT